MIASLRPSGSAVQVLALHASAAGAAEEATLLRLRLAHALARCDLQPAVMPPSALLFIRRLADPLPGALGTAPGSVASPAWERAGRAALATAWRQAARPARGPVPADSPAVAFSDEAEWLAWLLGALAGNAAAPAWWWRRWATAASAPQAVVAALAAHPRSVAAALWLLVQRGALVTVLRALPDAMAQRLTEGLLHDAALPLPKPPVAPVAPVAPGTAHEAAASTGFAAQAVALATAAGLDLSGLTPAQQQLAALAVGLQRWPRILQQAAAATRPLRQAEPSPRRPPVQPITVDAARPESQAAADTPPPSRTTQRHAALPMNTLTAASAAPPAATLLAAPSMAAAGHARAGERPGPAAAAAVAPPPAPVMRTRAAAAVGPATSARTGAAPRWHEAAAPSWARPAAATGIDGAPQTDAAPSLAPAEWPADGLPTRLAGAAFLINLMLHLDLPRAFEPGWALQRRLGPWGTLAVLTAAELGDDADADADDDALWPLLDSLAGPPGDDSTALPSRWRWPRGWLARAGVARPPRPLALPPLAARRAGVLAPLFEHLLPVLQARLRGALGDETAASLLRRPGRFHVGALHLDLVLPMAAISLPARRAGLDRSPGWLPGWDRVVTFHFE